jgi:hypothetical protein
MSSGGGSRAGAVVLAALMVLACALARPAGAVTAPGLRYDIEVRLDPERHRLEGWETVFYRSGADTALPAIYLHAYPNAFQGPHTVYGREWERMEDYSLRFTSPVDRGWMAIDSGTVDGAPAPVTVDETLARVDLPRPLEPGDSVSIRLRFSVQVPVPIDRLGRVGNRYAVGQWYPKVVVYDDLGWHLDPYHALAEFYGDFGTFDVAITLPDPFWVGATGVPAGVVDGDNEIPLAAEACPRDSVTVSLAVALADSLAGRWPKDGLTAEADLVGANGTAVDVTLRREGTATLRVPRGAPVHYSYRWAEGKGAPRDEADAVGRPSPLHLVAAWNDTSIVDTIRTLAVADAAPDTTLPSLKTVRFHAEQVHDFAWVASPEYVRSDTSWSGVHVRALVFRVDQRKWRGLAGMTVDAMRHFTDLVGPYAWPWFTATEAFMGGGAMEYPMLVMNDPDSYTKYFHTLDETNAHELGHNWFYGALGSDERAYPWLDEGFTQYLEVDYTAAKYPLGLCELTGRIPSIGKLTDLDVDEQAYLARAWARDEQPMSTPADRYHGYRAYAVASYSKPVAMLRALRSMLGDSVFVAFLHEYYRANLFRHPRPPDVVRAAEKVSGRDLSVFFHEWIETVEQASFAMDGTRSEREGAASGGGNGGGTRWTAIVKRKEAMVFPVKVGATFADGSTQEVTVDPKGRRTEATFSSESAMRSAEVDPHHEIVEMTRLDNGTGHVPPIRVYPLFAFPTSEAMGAAYGPTFWEGEWEGIRLGGWIDGRYLPSRDFPMGIRGFEGGLNVGTANGAVAYRAGAWRRWGSLGARGQVRGLVVRDEGMFRATLRAGNLATAPSWLHPYRWWTAAVEYRDRGQLPPVDASYWSVDRTLEVGVTLGAETRGPRRSEHAEITYRSALLTAPGTNAEGLDYQYRWVGVTAGQRIDLLPTGSLRVSWRVAAGSAFGTVPLERKFDIAEENRVQALQYFYANDRGPLRQTDHFFVPGGGGLRGYSGRAVLGQSLLSGSLEIAPRFHAAFLFADVGQVNPGGWGECGCGGLGVTSLNGQVLSDAGAGFSVGPVTVTFPIWVDHPPSDESAWSTRWLFSIGSIGLPSAFR